MFQLDAAAFLEPEAYRVPYARTCTITVNIYLPRTHLLTHVAVLFLSFQNEAM
jgi:hypothetical protein